MSKPVIFTISRRMGRRSLGVVAGIATTLRPPPTRRRSMNCWPRFRRWRSTCCRTIIRTSIRLRRSCRSPHCSVRGRMPLPDYLLQLHRLVAGLAARRGLRAGPPRQGQSRNLAQPDHKAEFRCADRHSEAATPLMRSSAKLGCQRRFECARVSASFTRRPL